MKNNFIFSLFLIVLGFGRAEGQTFLSEEWTKDGIASPIYNRTVVKTDPLGNVYKAGSTLNGTNVDMIVQKYSAAGVLLWENIYNGVAGLGDRAIDMVIDASYNVYVVGAVGKSVNANGEVHDICVVKYSLAGVQEWIYFYDGNGNDDIGTSITFSGSDLYVCGGSALTNGIWAYDILFFKLTTSTGQLVWESRYDSNRGSGYFEFPGRISVRGGLGSLGGYVGDASSPLTGTTIQLSFNPLNGVITNEAEIGTSVFGAADALRDYFIDNSSNIYIAGSGQLLSLAEGMRVWKLDPNLQVLLSLNSNPYGTTAIAKSVKVDNAGNIYVVGHANHPVERNNYILLKYNAAGVLQWQREYNGDANGDDNGEQVALIGNNYVVVTGSSDKLGEGVGVRTLLYNTNGELLNEIWHKYAPGSVDIPVGMTVDDQNNVVISATSKLGTTTHNLILKYKLYERASEIVLDTAGVPTHVAGEVIVRFNSNYVERAVIDRKGKQAGLLNEFIDPAAISAMSAKLGFDVSRLETYKIYKNMTTADSISLSRTEEWVKVDNHWAAFVINIPESIPEKSIIDSLNTIWPFVEYAEFNGVAMLASVPNDFYYLTKQNGLFNDLSDNGINAEDAWDIEVGQEYTKVGIFDTGINWEHEDLGDGTLSGTKVKGGWNFASNISEFKDYNGHGTAVAGIVGALRNNNIGVAGIAGGDVLSGNSGVTLYSMKIFLGDQSPATLSNISNAIVEGSLNTNANYGFGLDIQNHSWGTSVYSAELLSAVKTSTLNNSLIVSSRGNWGSVNCQTIDCNNYPSTFQDRLVLSVGANNLAGDRAYFSPKEKVDVIAPGTKDQYICLDSETRDGYIQDFGTLGGTVEISGTSFAAPHVAGLAALMHSKHNVLNGTNNNLATEDYEHLIEINSKPKNADFYSNTSNLPIPNDYAGWGRVDAYKTLGKVNFPYYSVKHEGGSYSPVQSITFNHNMIFNDYVGVSAGWYSTDRYQVTNTFLHVYSPNEEIIDVWPRFNQSRGFSQSNPNNGDTYFQFTTNIVGNVLSVTTTTFTYFVKYNSIGQQINRFVPAPPSNLRTYYSVHLKNNSPNINVEELDGLETLVFPNPTQDIFNVSFVLNENMKYQVEVLDVLGRRIMYHDEVLGNVGHNNMQVDISRFASGLYFLKLTAGKNIETFKIIKK